MELTSMTDVIAAIRACKYLYLGAITEPEVNRLRVVLLEAVRGATLSAERLAAETDETIRSILAGSHAIEHLKGCKKFELLWDSYIGYSVVNESYSNGEPPESGGKGRLFEEYERSNYLEYLSKASFATADYPGPFRHWAIYCLDHTIDVVSHVEPIARELGEG